MKQEIKLVKQFDKDGDKRLNTEERKAAREYVQKQAANRPGFGPGGRRGGFGPGRFGGEEEKVTPGAKVSPADVKSGGDAQVYDEKVMRTFFLEFENSDWEKELSDFFNSDVDVPAKLTVDGKTFNDVGVHFRGMSSYMMIPEGKKRSLNLSLDWKNENQNLGGYRTFNLLNANDDPSILHSVLYSHIAREYIPAPKANFVRVVINGEDWGVYPSSQQFNKDFVKDFFGTTKGARWKAPGSPAGHAGLEYLGENIDDYKKLFEIKTKDDAESWRALIQFCKVLNETPADKLEEALKPILDIDGALKFLALDVALINNDGYWTRASDYNLYRDEQGRFHIIPHDNNETFSAAGGPGFGGGPGGRRGGGRPGRDGFGPQRGTNVVAGAGTNSPMPQFGPGGPGGGFSRGGNFELDPLVGIDDSSKALRAKLLAVPALRERYLGYVRDIAEKWLDWNRLGPLAKQYHTLIAEAVKADTRKLCSNAEFLGSLESQGTTEQAEQSGRRNFGPGGPHVSLKEFAEKRRAYLLKSTATKTATK